MKAGLMATEAPKRGPWRKEPAGGVMRRGEQEVPEQAEEESTGEPAELQAGGTEPKKTQTSPR